MVHVERELCSDPTGVLDQTNSGTMSGDIQRVHNLDLGQTSQTDEDRRSPENSFRQNQLFNPLTRKLSDQQWMCAGEGSGVLHLVDKLFNQLKVLRTNAFGAVDQKHQVDVGGRAG